MIFVHDVPMVTSVVIELVRSLQAECFRRCESGAEIHAGFEADGENRFGLFPIRPMLGVT